MRSTTQHAKSPLSESSTTTMQIRLARSPGSSGSSGSSESVIAGTIPWKASRTLLGVFNPPLRNRELYVYPKEQDIVDRILKEVEDGKNMTYKVRFQDGHTELVRFIYCHYPLTSLLCTFRQCASFVIGTLRICVFLFTHFPVDSEHIKKSCQSI